MVSVHKVVGLLVWQAPSQIQTYTINSFVDGGPESVADIVGVVGPGGCLGGGLLFGRFDWLALKATSIRIRCYGFKFAPKVTM